MANIKFSQFTVGNTESDIDFVVGYKGANNIQISPTNLLAASLSGYLPLTGGTMTGDIVFNDNEKARFGTGLDAYIQHDSSNTEIINATGNLNIKNNATNGDITFFGDNGSGGVATYFSIDGGAQLNRFSKNVMWNDSVVAYFGGGFDLQISHNSADSYIENNTGNLFISNFANDKDIRFATDDGSGGVATYFFLDGSTASGGSLYTQFPDNSNLTFGAGNDLRIYHNGTNSNIENFNGSLQFVQNLNDGDINFLCDNGSGGVAEYFRLDGSSARTLFSKNTQYVDNSKAIFGNGDDLEIWHDGTDSIIQNDTGDLEIQNRQNDGDIVFKSDDGSGGVTEYFRLDGNLGYSVASKDIRLQDNVNIGMGSSGDYAQFHDGTNTYLSNGTGDFYIRNQADDKDIIFQADNGSGGNATYLFLDGQNTRTEFLKDVKFPDNVKANFGTSVDLQIYHDGSNSYIDETGTGNLRIRSTNTLELLNAAGSKYYASFTDGGSSKLFHNGSEKLETTSTGIKISGVSEYADNTAAIAGGLTTGDVYRTGDLLKIVH